MHLISAIIQTSEDILCLQRIEKPDQTKYTIVDVTKGWEKSYPKRQTQVLTTTNRTNKKIEVHLAAYLNTFICIWQRDFGLLLVSDDIHKLEVCLIFISFYQLFFYFS